MEGRVPREMWAEEGRRTGSPGRGGGIDGGCQGTRGPVRTVAGLGQEVLGVVRAGKAAGAGLAWWPPEGQVSWPLALLTGHATHQLCGWRELAIL